MRKLGRFCGASKFFLLCTTIFCHPWWNTLAICMGQLPTSASNVRTRFVRLRVLVVSAEAVDHVDVTSHDGFISKIFQLFPRRQVINSSLNAIFIDLSAKFISIVQTLPRLIACIRARDTKTGRIARHENIARRHSGVRNVDEAARIFLFRSPFPCAPFQFCFFAPLRVGIRGSYTFQIVAGRDEVIGIKVASRVFILDLRTEAATVQRLCSIGRAPREFFS